MFFFVEVEELEVEMPADDARWGAHAFVAGVRPGPFTRPCSNAACCAIGKQHNHVYALCGRKGGGIDLYKHLHPRWRDRLR